MTNPLKQPRKRTDADERKLRAERDRLRKEMDDLNSRGDKFIEREDRVEELERDNERKARLIARIKHGDPTESEKYESVQNMTLDVGGKEFGPVYKNDFIRFPGLFNRPRRGSEAGRQPNFGGFVLGCIDADFCK